MIKIKIFSSDDVRNLEQYVNEFVSDKKVVDVKYQSILVPTKYSMNGFTIAATIYDRAMVIYEEKE